MNAASQFLFNELKFQLESLKQSVLKLEKEFDKQVEEGSIGNNPVIWIGTDGDTYKTSIPKTDGTIFIYDQANGIYPVEIVNWGKSKGVLNIKIDLGATLSRKGLLGKVPPTSPMWTNNFSKLFYNQQYFDDFNVTLWDTSHVTNMGDMFLAASKFNQPIGDWNTSNVTVMTSMFHAASSFNQPINKWNTSNVVAMKGMFQLASKFNQPIDKWDVSNVTDMTAVFTGASSFNQSLNRWDTGRVTTMYATFNGASSFNQPLNKWDVSNVTDMFGMFAGASNFNQDLSQWCVEKIKTIPEYFDMSAVAWTLPRPIWGTCTPKDRPLKYLNEQGEVVEYTLILGEIMIEDAVEVLDWGWINDWDSHNEEYMFALYSPKLVKVPDDGPKWTTNYSALFMAATSFNQDISNWDMSHVTNMYGMFAEATSFNQDIGNWDVSNVTNMMYMFGGAESFNQDISRWDVSKVENMDLMFAAFEDGTSSFNQDLSSWCVSKIPNKPNDFDDGAASWTKPKPIWGTCPRGEDKK